MSNFKSVRCGSSKPTPFLRKNIGLLTECVDAAHVVDIGCGNGRNSIYLRDLGMHVMSLDGKGDYGIKWKAGNKIPTEAGSVDIILCNYVLMFLKGCTRNDVYAEIDRVAVNGCRLMIEVDNIKNSLINTEDLLEELNDEIKVEFEDRGWRVLKLLKNKYIYEKRV